MRLPIIIALLVLAGLARLAAQPSVEATLSSQFLVSGETAVLEIMVSEGQPEAVPVIPAIEGVNLRNEGFGMAQPRMLPGRAVGYAFQYSLTSFEPGTYEIPAIEVFASGQTLRTAALTFAVVASDELSWQETPLGTGQLRYATIFAASSKNPFVNQTVPVELKVYIPAAERVEDWGLPDFERDGINVWRFEPNRLNGSVTLNGTSYISVSYPSTLTPTRGGEVTLGPGKLRLVTVQSIPDVFGFRASYQPAQLVVPALKLAARELPAGAPQGFEQTVGSFSLSAKIEDSQLAAGDPANVTLTISGRGNMDSVRVPRLLDPNGWKVYDAVPRQRGQERRNLTGEVVFTQLIRPLQPKSLIPPFRMVYFDPEEELYKTLLTDPIKLELSAAPPGIGVQPQAPQARPVPAEQLGDILGIIEVSRGGTNSWAGQLPRWAWQIIPALIVLGLIGNFVGRRLARRFAKHPDVVAKRAALREVERAPGEAAGFYRAAGRFVEAWLGDDHAEEIAAIIAERDRVCFQPDGSEPAKLAGAQRRAVLRALRRHALVWVLAAAGLLATSGESLAADSANPYTEADKAYQQGRFAEAAKGFAAPHQERGDYPADVLYNIANCYYRLDQPGYAALFYRRALLVNPAHPEARQNLRYLEKSHGALVVPRSDTQQMLGVLGLHTWQSLTMLGGWLVAIGVLGLLLTRPGSPAKPTAIALLVIGPVLLLTGGLGWYYYPDDARFAPVERQAVVVAPDTMVRTAASRNAADVIMAPAGSLAEVVATRGRWTYLSFASKTRGWVPSDTVEPLVAPGPLELKSLAKPPVPPPPPLNLTPGA